MIFLQQQISMIKRISLIFRFSTSSSTSSSSTSTSTFNINLNIKERLIQTALHYVPKYGWNDRAIHAACGMLDLSPAAHRIISPFQLITYSMKKWNEESIRIIDDTNFGNNKKISQKVEFAIKTRLSKQIPFIDTWGEAMAIGAKPSNVMQTKDLLWSFSDDVWYRCGDKSTDYNYYTKRVLFNSAYATTQLFMLTDQSPQYFATWQFLQRRLQNISTIGKTVNDLKTVLQHGGNGLLSLLTMFKTPQKYQNPIEQARNKLNQENKSQPTKNQQKEKTNHQNSTSSQTEKIELNQTNSKNS